MIEMEVRRGCLKGLRTVGMTWSMGVQRHGCVHDLGWAVQKFTPPGETLLRNSDLASLGNELGIRILRSPLLLPPK